MSLVGQNFNVNTSIQPTPVFSQPQTAAGVSQMMANAAANANIPSLAKAFYSPSSGMSMGAAQLARAVPQAAATMSAGRTGAANLALGDAAQNAQSVLQGQQAREAQALNLGSLASQQQQNQFNNMLQQQQNGMSLLENILGGGGLLGGSAGAYAS
jgi:uncharacterized protein (DUF1501 family)